MLDKTQSQDLDVGAIGVQANRDVIINVGVTAAEVRAIATDIFKADFVRLMGDAEVVAEARARKVLDEFLDRIQFECPESLEQASDPDFRYMLFAVQKAVARSGDPKLQDTLIELLVRRSAQTSRSLLQLVLSESIEVVPRLSNGQINALTVAFMLRRVKFGAVSTFDSFLKTMDVFLAPIQSDLWTSNASSSHLEFAGCGRVIESADQTMAEMLRRFYPGIFQTGVTEADARVKGLSESARSLLVQCESDPRKVQVIGGTDEMLAKICDEKRLSDSDRKMLGHIFRETGMTDQHVRDKCVNARPYLEDVFDAWDQSNLSALYPSSVGVAIAHARLARCGVMDPLSKWIN